MSNKRKRSIWEIFCLSGVPWAVITFVIVMVVHAQIETFRDTEKDSSPISPFGVVNENRETSQDGSLQAVLLITGAVWLLVFIKNLTWVGGGNTKKIGLLTWTEPYKPDVNQISARKKQAQAREVPAEYLSPVPDGLVLGKKGKDFVRYKLKRGNVLHTMILGSAGTGKSTLLLTSLIYNFHMQNKLHEQGKGDEPMVVFVTDIKPELAAKSVVSSSVDTTGARVHVMNPENRSTYGWDVYYDISPDSSTDQILSALDVVSRALIYEGENGAEGKNSFFYNQARTIFKALMLLSYREGRSFIQGIRYLMDGCLGDIIAKTIDYVEDKIDYQAVKRLLAPFAGKDSDAFQDIEMTLYERFSIFIRDDVAFFLDGNPRKASPLDLENKISLFFSLKETSLDEMKGLLRLVSMMVFHHCMGRPEGSHLITIFADECPRWGRGIDFAGFMALSRSRETACILAGQSFLQWEKVWGKEEAKIILELCRISVILSNTDPDSGEIFCKWAGTYKERKANVTETGKQSGSRSVSYEDKPVLEPYDILNLQDEGAAIVYIKGQMYKVNVTKARYYNVPQLKKISLKCFELNGANNKEKE